MPAPIAVIAGLFLFDLWMYAWHRANHEVPLLWRLHRVHHTDPRMDSTTAFRFHPGEIAVSALLNAVVILGLDHRLVQ
ncbi:sterol desaturase family protein, partial [Thiocapsa sp. UBA6158]|uniref:sterol desaturase family protein n=1 Tax=Thiocapsa sp. UBA6158 TaxID=1947692 RepID=UPI0025CEE2A1